MCFVQYISFIQLLTITTIRDINVIFFFLSHLILIVSEFAQELGAAMEGHAANVRRLVDEFRGRSGESRNDTGGMRRVWENLLRQVEADAAAHLDLAAVLQQQISRPTLEASFQRKLQSRKVCRPSLTAIKH